ncbi:hypothetical protein HNQ59_002436 [Chitinivorax tropicus]|uniref:Uncharacterized protein n=1 Tax=Chitinivorax tropicus TaxID=714531 RepID=A0A840MKF7_9PROT|nr:hypothetical protein [Chitinivorax tropicus]MBB5019138.1 hypothetical protein [Chitinivorax tropicus]
MPLLIDEIITDVTVEPAGNSTQQAQRPAQPWRSQANLQAMQAVLQQDECRTSAWGNED